MKRCPKCRQVKAPCHFYRSSKNAQGLAGYCKQCSRLAHRAWVRANPDKERNLQLKKLYGIGQADYLLLFKAQQGRCRVCQNRLAQLTVDHCHNTKKIRGLLCSTCNCGLGMLKHSVKNLIRAITYLS
jgi:protein-arginine kinase activator protein McsA